MDIKLANLLITTAVALLGWLAVHRFNVYRDQLNKRREIRIQYLIEAYRRLEQASHRADMQKREDFESAIADIQLLGSNRQIDLTLKVIDSIAKNGFATVNPLLEDLRGELRKELNLEMASEEIKIFRFSNTAMTKKENS
jgi:hypothetical protein